MITEVSTTLDLAALAWLAEAEAEERLADALTGAFGPSYMTCYRN